MPDPAAASVRALLDTASLAVSEEEFQRFVAVYPILRAQADQLYGLPELAGLDPAITYDPTDVERA